MKRYLEYKDSGVEWIGAIRPVCCRSLRGSPLNKPPSGENKKGD